MKIAAIIQARTSSSRLPEKVLKTLPYNSDTNILQQVIRRTKKSKYINNIVVATTTEKEDEKIIETVKREKVNYHRGSLENVLERYYLAAKENKADIIVRITSDCPCIDAKIIDMLIEKHLKEKNDYTNNFLERSFPHGLDAEVFNFDVLEKAYFNANKKYETEHVTPYIYKTDKSKFKIGNLKAAGDYFAPDIRITVDTEEDYALLCIVYDYLYKNNNFFDIKDIIKLFKEKPFLKLINQKIIQKKIFDNLSEEINEAVKILKLQDLNKAADILRNRR